MTNSTYFDEICSIENLKSAYYKASLRKRKSNSYLCFRKNQEENLLALQKSLLEGTWTPGKYRQFQITDPKKRTITAAQFSDRIVHHAIILVLESLFEKKFIFHTYACRKGKGTHAAILYAQKFCKKGVSFLKLDVRKYFDSIDHEILKKQLLRLTNEGKTQILLRKIIDSYTSAVENEKNEPKGLPIGNLTSQYFANLYLTGLDHFILEHFKPLGYLRYMDDMVIFSKSFNQLKRIFHEIEEYTKKELKLSLKPPIFAHTEDGLPFLGKLISHSKIRPLAQKMRYKRKKIKRIDFLVRTGNLTEEKAAERIYAIMQDAGCYDKKNAGKPLCRIHD